ncbi:MAG: hypothetical protein M1823_005263 [Watsoniomyces obsoletus]|nr:MAG: hypothetical protein M1823_005263 [Watsoniomyces obsoletus]
MADIDDYFDDGYMFWADDARDSMVDLADDLAEHMIPSPRWDGPDSDYDDYYLSDYQNWSEDEDQSSTSQEEGKEDKEKAEGEQKAKRKRTSIVEEGKKKKKGKGRPSDQKNSSSQVDSKQLDKSHNNRTDDMSPTVDPATRSVEHSPQLDISTQEDPINDSDSHHSSAEGPVVNTTSRASQSRDHIMTDIGPKLNRGDPQGVQPGLGGSKDEEPSAKEPRN